MHIWCVEPLTMLWERQYWLRAEQREELFVVQAVDQHQDGLEARKHA
jgi:hypothetical protein